MQLFPFIILAFVLALDWYVFQGIRVLTADLERSRVVVHGLYWMITAVILGSLLLAGNPGFRSSLYFKIVGNFFIALFVAKLVFIVVLFGEDIFRFLKGIYQYFSGTKAEGGEGFLPGRRKFVSQVALGLASIPFASVIYGIFKGKYDYTVHRTTLYFKDLPEAFDGFRIVQLSDIHSGSFDNRSAVARGVALVKAQNPDLFVFTGDLVNNLAGEMTPWLDLFGQIRAPYGQYAVLGNHDYGEYIPWESPAAKMANFEAIKALHPQMGYRLLLDEHVRIEKNGAAIVLAGVENWGTGFVQRGDLDKALAGVSPEAFTILLSHDPSHWEEQVKHHEKLVHLTLSGHTHGMQFGVEIPGFRWSPVQYRYRHWAGVARAADRVLYVNRGFGFLGFSGRVGIWPEVGVLELRRG